jgi:transcriptional regulator with XRE-family HTH domain
MGMETVINALMTKKKVSQTELAKVLGVSQPALSNWLRGQRRITPEYLEGIAKILEMPYKKLEKIFKENLRGVAPKNRKAPRLAGPCPTCIRRARAIVKNH